jgi:hypothetical protein
VALAVAAMTHSLQTPAAVVVAEVLTQSTPFRRLGQLIRLRLALPAASEGTALEQAGQAVTVTSATHQR